MYDSSVAFTSDEINLIEQAGLTIEELRDFYCRFPDQDLVTAIGGCVMEKQRETETVTTTIQPETEPVTATTEDSKLPETTSEVM